MEGFLSEINEHPTREYTLSLWAAHDKLMKEGAKALEAGRMNEYAAVHSDDLIFHVFGRSEVEGDYSGKRELLNIYDQFCQLVGGDKFSIDVHDTLTTVAHGIWLIQFFPNRDKSLEEHDTMYVVCHFNGGLISEAWFVFWPPKMIISPLPPDGHYADGRSYQIDAA
jgi:hypothetical protein